MSWWVYLVNEKEEPLFVRRHYGEGGTYLAYSESPFGRREEGSVKAELNVTYNYGKFYRAYLDPEGLKWLDGKTAKHARSRLEQAVHILGTKKSLDYWEPSNGNAGFALSILLEWAKQYPNGVFVVN